MNEASFPKLTTKEAFNFTHQMNDAEDGELFDWTGWTATVRVVDRDRPSNIRLTGTSSGSYVTLPSAGILMASFPAPHNLCPGQYLVGLILENGNPSDTVQQFIGTLPVVEGV